MPRLDDDALARALQQLPGWTVRDGALSRTYRFRGFVDAFAFMTACALRIEALDHHPEWSNVHGTVRVALVTHDAGGITGRDTALAAEMEALATRALP
jgi:4a-hydroxytetrahydrobiopterin dehydratase